MTSVARGGADLVEFAPTSDLVGYELERKNPAAATKRRTKKAKPSSEWSVAGMQLYDGYEGLLVRTVLLRSTSFQEKDLPVIRSSNDVARLCRHLGLMDREHLVTLCLNTRTEVQAIHENAIGIASRAETTADLLIKVPLLTGSRAFIIVHNHPGGRAWPSPDDIKMAKAIVKASQCVGLQLLDSVIVSADGHYSLMEAGDL